MLNYNCLHFNGILVLASLFFSPEDGYLLADKFTKNTLNTACLHLYIYIYTHTHTHIYIHAHTHCVVAAQMLHVLESETQRYGPNCGAIDLCRGYRVRGLSWTHTTLNAVSSVPTLAFSSTFLPTCYSTCESFDSLMLSITTPLNKSAYKIYAWSSSQATFCPRLRRRWK